MEELFSSCVWADSLANRVSQNRWMMPAPAATMLREEDGVVWTPPPIVAVALMICVPLPVQDDANAGAPPAIATPIAAHFSRRLFSAILRSPFVLRVPFLENVFSEFNGFLSKWLVGSYAERRRVGAGEAANREQA
ncbi:hypothetical protein M3I53_18015 [Paraburkholderia sp. CNPSo 3272]|uniref:hypothetical protein n=1 Tax=Paraburkholderia sp. CNPSo 3272 TaxID=2940931 RepID=UPI0020B66AC3|nr:hypothetical protein [Paraburkholderia sp. CNPSo 3272]MCP3724997.1 hypothetical protein [Paraburkholderia sp. CNPSo 3272]